MDNYRLPAGERFEVPQDKKLVGNILYPKQIEVFKTEANIDASRYSLVQDRDRVIAVSTSPRYFGSEGKDFAGVNAEVLGDKLIVATPRQFLTSWRDVNSALKELGVRYNALGKLIEPEQNVQDAQVMNHAWAYLNARFPQGTGFRGLDIITITGIKDGKPIFTRVPLSPCLEEVCLADVESMNEQGMLTEKAKTNKYEPGKTITFYPPILSLVAGFNAGSDGAGFSCYRNGSDRDASLGVFTSAEKNRAFRTYIFKSKNSTSLGLVVLP